MTILNFDANPKTIKGQKFGYITGVLYLAPFDLSGFQVCPMADIAGCVAGCLNTAGRGGMARKDAPIIAHNVRENSVQLARIRKTRDFMNNRESFMQSVCNEIARKQRAIKRAAKKAKKRAAKLVIRLNGTSDIRWENVRFFWNGKTDTIFGHFPDLQFYDYTKVANRRISHISNYHLTFSYSGTTAFEPFVNRAVENYGTDCNIAVSFIGGMPATFLGRDVINGDESDLRFLDRSGVVVGLRAKGRAKKDNSGFSVKVAA
jgi:hypothetical protein